jgi:hypothetical protein
VEDKGNAYRVFLRSFLGNGHLIPRRQREDNNKVVAWMDCEDGRWMELAQIVY